MLPHAVWRESFLTAHSEQTLICRAALRPQSKVQRFPCEPLSPAPSATPNSPMVHFLPRMSSHSHVTITQQPCTFYGQEAF